jgi:hypothetical protein
MATVGSGCFELVWLQSDLVVLISRFGGVMVSVRSSKVIDHEFDAWAGQTKDYTMDICCFSFKDAILRCNNKDWWTLSKGNKCDRLNQHV